MIKLAEYLGGSHLYGLATPESDQDIRFIFLNEDISDIIGLTRHEHQDGITKNEDIFGFELRNFFKLLKKGNTQSLEAIFNNQWLYIANEFKRIQNYKYDLIDSATIFKCLSGYAISERKMIAGETTGKLGEKRKAALEKFGYSYRNSVHAIRLLRSGIIFFETGNYPVNIVNDDKEYGLFLLDLKTNPGNYKKEDILNLIDKLDLDLKKSFDNRSQNFAFKSELANFLILDNYIDILTERYLGEALARNENE